MTITAKTDNINTFQATHAYYDDIDGKPGKVNLMIIVELSEGETLADKLQVGLKEVESHWTGDDKFSCQANALEWYRNKHEKDNS